MKPELDDILLGKAVQHVDDWGAEITQEEKDSLLNRMDVTFGDLSEREQQLYVWVAQHYLQEHQRGTHYTATAMDVGRRLTTTAAQHWHSADETALAPDFSDRVLIAKAADSAGRALGYERGIWGVVQELGEIENIHTALSSISSIWTVLELPLSARDLLQAHVALSDLAKERLLPFLDEMRERGYEERDLGHLPHR